MGNSRWKVVLIVASIAGGLFFTFLSGLYWVRDSHLVGVEAISYGYPFAWFRYLRNALWMPRPPASREWHSFIVLGFIADFIVYGLLTCVAVYILFAAVAARTRLSR
jgi:hypothetical protein